MCGKYYHIYIIFSLWLEIRNRIKELTIMDAVKSSYIKTTNIIIMLATTCFYKGPVKNNNITFFRIGFIIQNFKILRLKLQVYKILVSKFWFSKFWLSKFRFPKFRNFIILVFIILSFKILIFKI